MSAAQLPRKTGTLNLAQWSQAGRELQCTDVHHRVGEGRGTDSAQHCPSPCSIPRPPKPVPMAGQTQRAATPGRGLGIWQGKGEESLSMAKHKHLEAWPGVLPPLSRTPSPAGLSGAAAKDGKGNPNPERKHRAATLLSYSRDPRWHGGSEEHCLLPSEWRSCQQAGPRLQQPGRVRCSHGEAVPGLKDVSSNKSLCLAEGEAPKANKPLAQGAPAGRRTVNQCITEVQGARLLCQGWSAALALAERLPAARVLPRGAERPGPAPLGTCGSAGSQELTALCPGQMVWKQEAGELRCGCNTGGGRGEQLGASSPAGDSPGAAGRALSSRPHC